MLDISFSSPFTLPCCCKSDQSGFPTLTPVGPSSNILLHATADELILDNYPSTVYAATLKHDNSRVVLKLSLDVQSFDDLKHEAIHYRQQLNMLQGDIVPKFYGFYEGSCAAHSRRKIGCLVLEHCGTRIPGEFHDLPLDER